MSDTLRSIATRLGEDFMAQSYDAEEMLIRAANCIEAMAREAGRKDFSARGIKAGDWLEDNWHEYVPAEYRDLVVEKE